MNNMISEMAEPFPTKPVLKNKGYKTHIVEMTKREI